MQNAGYRLRFSSEHFWYLSCYNASLNTWLSRFAAIMELDANVGMNSRKRIICTMAGDSSILPEQMLNTGASNSDWCYHRMKTMTYWSRRGNDETTYCVFEPYDSEQDEIIAMSHILYPVYHSAICDGCLPVHAGFIEYDGKGVLLAGVSGTGKSTCCRRLPSGHWRAVSDDQALIVTDGDGGIRVHPLPTWSDYMWNRSEKTWKVERSIPLHAVFFIYQSENELAEKVGQGEAAAMTYSASMQIWRKYLRTAGNEYIRAQNNRVFENASALALKIPAYTLGVRLDGCYWEEIERVLGW